jgi:hypothetical protein
LFKQLQYFTLQWLVLRALLTVRLSSDWCLPSWQIINLEFYHEFVCKFLNDNDLVTEPVFGTQAAIRIFYQASPRTITTGNMGSLYKPHS